MERRFGRKNIVRLVDKYYEEQANKKWLEASTMACAGCGVSVEKSLGCNHVRSHPSMLRSGSVTNLAR